MSRIYLEPKGEALKAVQDYRQACIDAKTQYHAFATERGADGYLFFGDSKPSGLSFNRRPQSVPDHYKMSRGRHGYHLFLRSPKALKTRDAVLAEKDVIAALPSIPDLTKILNGFGLPHGFSYENETVRGSASLGSFMPWQPTWTSLESRVFLVGQDIRKIAAEYPDHTVTFSHGDGTIPAAFFDLLPEHHVVFIQGEEKAAAAEAA